MKLGLPVLSRAFAVLVVCLMTVVAMSVSAQGKAPWVGKTLNGQPCRGGQLPTGPFDYLQRDRSAEVAEVLHLAERDHFDKGVETLTKGMSTTPLGDIDYVLKVFPNHHRALNSAMQFSLRRKKHPAEAKGLPAECYLQRAIKFSPDDGVPYRLYGYYLHRKNRYAEALKVNEQALRFYPKDVMLNYNTGLILVELKKYDRAMELARPLYDAGLTLPGLKDKLIAARKWEYSEEEKAAFKAQLEATTADEGAGETTGADMSVGDGGDIDVSENTAGATSTGAELPDRPEEAPASGENPAASGSSG